VGKDASEVSPGTGRKTFLGRRFFRPVPGLAEDDDFPTAHAVGYFLTPSGLKTFSSVYIHSDI